MPKHGVSRWRESRSLEEKREIRKPFLHENVKEKLRGHMKNQKRGRSRGSKSNTEREKKIGN